MSELSPAARTRLFWACFIALVTTAFAFMLRVQLMGEWEVAFGLDKTQAGTILGAGFWPFGVSRYCPNAGPQFSCGPNIHFSSPVARENLMTASWWRTETMIESLLGS